MKLIIMKTKQKLYILEEILNGSFLYELLKITKNSIVKQLPIITFSSRIALARLCTYRGRSKRKNCNI